MFAATLPHAGQAPCQPSLVYTQVPSLPQQFYHIQFFQVVSIMQLRYLALTRAQTLNLAAMAAIDMSLVARSETAVHQLVKRKNWAAKEPGVILVFAIIGAVGILLIGLFVQKKVSYFRDN